MCMQVKSDKMKLAAVGYRQADMGKLQLLIQSEDAVYADEFNVCILYRPIGLYACQLCY